MDSDDSWGPGRPHTVFEQCWINRVSHAQIDEIIAFEPLFGFHLIDHTKKIWRQLRHTLCELDLMLLCHGFLLAEHQFKKSPERFVQRLKKSHSCVFAVRGVVTVFSC
jgi:hypothetical protein